MNSSHLLLEKGPDGVATITLNRPDKRNAFDDSLIAALIQAFEDCDRDPGVRVMLLQATGSHFSAGADLDWMRRMARYDFADNRADALELARLMQTLHQAGKPTLARVQGSAFGGALGLIACCDIAIASEDARFCLSEVKLGLAPAVISPYLVAAMGERACRRYFLSAEIFDAREAWRLGLVHEVVAPQDLDQAVAAMAQRLKSNGPRAMNASKQLIRRAASLPLGPELITETAEVIARLRVSEEGQEGLNAFFDKRQPNWP